MHKALREKETSRPLEAAIPCQQTTGKAFQNLKTVVYLLEATARQQTHKIYRRSLVMGNATMHPHALIATGEV
jgi:hypothetical protein